MNAHDRTGLPLTLTLSPQAGRGDGHGGAPRPFSPFTGRRCRQADEGRALPLLALSMNLPALEARHAPRF